MDDELLALLALEVDRYAGELAADPSPRAARRVMHALKGALGSAGAREAAATCARIERRLAGPRPGGVERAIAFVGELAAALARGELPDAPAWPEPPPDLEPSVVDPDLSADYLAAVHDRVARLGALSLVSSEPEGQAAAAHEAFREVHALKGAALAVGDDVMAWFCHGLEERLRAPAPGALEQVARHTSVIAEIALDPARALASLRPGPPSLRPALPALPLPPRRPSSLAAPDAADDDTVRVAAAALDALFDRAGHLGRLRAPLLDTAGRAVRGAASMRQTHGAMREALRMIGPPRPWGAPAAAIQRLERASSEVAALAATLEEGGRSLGGLVERLARDGEALVGAVSELRTVEATRLFDRLALAAKAQAERDGKELVVVVSGGDTPIDRRLVDALAEPMHQLVRNAVVHGIEPASERIAAGKPPRGTLRLAASVRAGSLFLVVEDDGAGVDRPGVARAAERAGLLERGAQAADHTLLELLFLPGLTTRADADLLAGRGVGLDLTLAAVHRQGGTIHLESPPGRGLTATIVVPTEGALVRVAWLTACGTRFALPVQHAGRVTRLPRGERRVPPLARFVAGAAAEPAGPTPLAIEILSPVPGPGPALRLAVEAITGPDEAALRTLPPLARALGPYAAGIVRGDEIFLALDPLQLQRLARSDAQPTSAR